MLKRKIEKFCVEKRVDSEILKKGRVSKILENLEIKSQ